MTVTVQLPPEMVEALRVLAGRRGRDLDSTIAELLGDQLQRQAMLAPSPSPPVPTESALLQQIQQGLSEATWQRYHDLQAKREAEQLTPQEHAELIALTDQIEDWNVRRLELAQQLAARRGVSWQEIVAELGLAAPSRA
jgi:AraC-like DNA-binding protein